MNINEATTVLCELGIPNYLDNSNPTTRVYFDQSLFMGCLTGYIELMSCESGDYWNIEFFGVRPTVTSISDIKSLKIAIELL